jgi:hypothetical protein
MWTSLVSTADQVEGCMHHEPCSVWPGCTTTSTGSGGGGGGVPWVNQDCNWYALVPWQKTPNVLEQLLKHHRYAVLIPERKSGPLSPNLTFPRRN